MDEVPTFLVHGLDKGSLSRGFSWTECHSFYAHEE
jgi:hypothetical protein